MIQSMRQTGKKTASWLLSRSIPHYRYRNCVFVLAHMRCGSTALSNVLCSRPDVSGYGEAHVRHDEPAALGQLALNQMRRGGWKPRAEHLFDKILHSRHDRDATPEFFEARAIFMVRRPGDAIASIVKLFADLRREQYRTDEEAAIYYVERLTALEALWRRFPRERRIGVTHETLVQDPERVLTAISDRLGFDPPLENRYVSLVASRRGGGGDPLVSGRHTRIESQFHDPDSADAPLQLPPGLAGQAWDLYNRLRIAFGDDGPQI